MALQRFLRQVGSGLIFKLYSESRNPNAKELLVDFILEWMDDYDDPTWLPSVEVPITETLEKQQTPAGTFTFCANRPDANKTLNAKNVKLKPPTTAIITITTLRRVTATDCTLCSAAITRCTRLSTTPT